MGPGVPKLGQLAVDGMGTKYNPRPQGSLKGKMKVYLNQSTLNM